MTRSEALAQNLITYHGRPCKRCSSTEKYVPSYGCVKCTAERVTKRDSSINEKYSKSPKGKATRKMYRLTEVSKQVQRRWVNKDYVKWPDKYKDRHLQNLYNITLSEYNEQLAAQNDRCYICQVHVDELTRQLAVDHCHKSGKIENCFV